MDLPLESTAILSSHTEEGWRSRGREKSSARHGGGQWPGKRVCSPSPVIDPLNTPDGEASSMSRLLVSLENFLISGLGADISAPSE